MVIFGVPWLLDAAEKGPYEDVIILSIILAFFGAVVGAVSKIRILNSLKKETNSK